MGAEISSVSRDEGADSAGITTVRDSTRAQPYFHGLAKARATRSPRDAVRLEGARSARRAPRPHWPTPSVAALFPSPRASGTVGLAASPSSPFAATTSSHGDVSAVRLAHEHLCLFAKEKFSSDDNYVLTVRAPRAFSCPEREPEPSGRRAGESRPDDLATDVGFLRQARTRRAIERGRHARTTHTLVLTRADPRFCASALLPASRVRVSRLESASTASRSPGLWTRRMGAWRAAHACVKSFPDRSCRRGHGLDYA